LLPVSLALCVGQDDKNVNWSQERYDEITKNMAGYLKKIGYNPEKGACES
jgi:translation elongation factor EF-1alpha